MAVTSAMSAELVAVASLWTYDIYKVYLRPNAKEPHLIRTSHWAVFAFALVMSGFSVGLSYIGISMGYLYLLMGIIISSAVVPIVLAVTWKRLNLLAVVASPLIGFALAIGAWLGTAKHDFGELTVASTGANNPMLVGNVVALLSPVVFVFGFTIVRPANYNFQSMKQIQLDDNPNAEPENGGSSQALSLHNHPLTRDDLLAQAQQLNKAGALALSIAAFLTFAFLVLWPMPMYGSGYIFSANFFTGWIVVGMIWIFLSLFA